MPTYEYECRKCGRIFEEFQSITAEPLTVCTCGEKGKVRRMIGTGAGIIFKGSGFYETDYRSESYKKAAEAEKKSGSETSSAPEKKKGADSGAGKKDKKSSPAKPAATGSD